MNIAVYCSAREGLEPEVIEDARQLGHWIGSNGHTLVYGGLTLGLMGVVADAVARAGGSIIGVVPQSRLQYQHPENSVNLMVSTLHERKQIMEENANAFVALDGGFGTTDEVMSALASGAFFNEDKPIMLLNRRNLYTPIKTMLDEMATRHLAHPRIAARLTLCPDLPALLSALESIPQE